jgi:predicted peroxiredoxin
MTDKQKMVVIVTNGFNDERSSVAWSVANGGVGMGFEVTMFLVSSGVDWVRKRAAAVARPNPLDPPIQDMIQTVLDSGGEILVCPPCAGVRGYAADDLIEGVTLAGSASMLAVAKQGAVTLSF